MQGRSIRRLLLERAGQTLLGGVRAVRSEDEEVHFRRLKEDACVVSQRRRDYLVSMFLQQRPYEHTQVRRFIDEKNTPLERYLGARFGELLVKARKNGVFFPFVNAENGCELGHLEQVVHEWAGFGEPEITAVVASVNGEANQQSHAGA